VFAGEVDDLRTWMGAAARGEAFVLMGGDCAETFAEVLTAMEAVSSTVDSVSLASVAMSSRRAKKPDIGA